MGRQRSSCSQCNCPDRRSAIVSSAGWCIDFFLPFSLCFPLVNDCRGACSPTCSLMVPHLGSENPRSAFPPGRPPQPKGSQPGDVMLATGKLHHVRQRNARSCTRPPAHCSMTPLRHQRRAKKLDNKREEQYTEGSKNVCSPKEHESMGQATRTTKLLLRLGKRDQGGAN